ncbi:hypothetical protein ACIBG8_41110 [Nonomuraea sp. NPDC050556]|uniref:DUF7927 domain-containing protein n=1 Tax=Nonomuraea sp. NPDC050556 TaxID=3364369 RepID=UPI0037BBF965
MIRDMAVALTALACVMSSVGVAAAAAAEYAEWELSGKSGTVEVPAVGFPAATFVTDAGGLQVPSGASTFLNAETPFGAEFGSSKDHGYLKFGTASGGKPSTTTVTFDAPTTPGDWGFALGDIDADSVKIVARGADGKVLTAEQLGWQGAFNYCTGSPKPSSCGRTPGTDMPTWDAATSTLRGNVVDTSGASGWFKPTVPVKSLELVFTVQSGIPVGQLWIAAKWSEKKPDIVITKSASPHDVKPGGTVTYTVKVANQGDADEDHAEFSDDLSDVIDDARYNNDVSAGGTYSKPMLTWEGPVKAGETVTVTYSATVNDPPKGNRSILNAIIGNGPRMTCQDGKGEGCAVAVTVEKPKRHKHKHHHHRPPGNACRGCVDQPSISW